MTLPANLVNLTPVPSLKNIIGQIIYFRLYNGPSCYFGTIQGFGRDGGIYVKAGHVEGVWYTIQPDSIVCLVD